jgi:hypothetical protein
MDITKGFRRRDRLKWNPCRGWRIWRIRSVSSAHFVDVSGGNGNIGKHKVGNDWALNHFIDNVRANILGTARTDS